jgi:hypothetical protein
MYFFTITELKILLHLDRILLPPLRRQFNNNNSLNLQYQDEIISEDEYIPFRLRVQTLSKIFPYILEIHSLCIYTNWYRIEYIQG